MGLDIHLSLGIGFEVKYKECVVDIKKYDVDTGKPYLLQETRIFWSHKDEQLEGLEPFIVTGDDEKPFAYGLILENSPSHRHVDKISEIAIEITPEIFEKMAEMQKKYPYEKIKCWVFPYLSY